MTAAVFEMKFECTACGRCCYGGDDYFVSLTEEESEAIRKTLDISKAWFGRRYLQSDELLGLGLQFRDDGACVLLDKQGQCRAYRQRPAQCRTYPFWPELVSSRKQWQQESDRCEGIGRGSVINRSQD